MIPRPLLAVECAPSSMTVAAAPPTPADAMAIAKAPAIKAPARERFWRAGPGGGGIGGSMCIGPVPVPPGMGPAPVPPGIGPGPVPPGIGIGPVPPGIRPDPVPLNGS